METNRKKQVQEALNHCHKNKDDLKGVGWEDRIQCQFCEKEHSTQLERDNGDLLKIKENTKILVEGDRVPLKSFRVQDIESTFVFTAGYNCKCCGRINYIEWHVTKNEWVGSKILDKKIWPPEKEYFNRYEEETITDGIRLMGRKGLKKDLLENQTYLETWHICQYCNKRLNIRVFVQKIGIGIKTVSPGYIVAIDSILVKRNLASLVTLIQKRGSLKQDLTIKYTCPLCGFCQDFTIPVNAAHTQQNALITSHEMDALKYMAFGTLAGLSEKWENMWKIAKRIGKKLRDKDREYNHFFVEERKTVPNKKNKKPVKKEPKPKRINLCDSSSGLMSICNQWHKDDGRKNVYDCKFREKSKINHTCIHLRSEAVCTNVEAIETPYSFKISKKNKSKDKN